MINCGTDIVKISRLEKALETPGFYEKVFGKNERAEFEKRGARLESLAAAFAAKEAFGKALGTGIRGFSLCEAEVLHKENGAPYLFLSGKAKAVSDKIHAEFSLSLSHDGDYATAFVICVTKGETYYDENIAVK